MVERLLRSYSTFSGGTEGSYGSTASFSPHILSVSMRKRSEGRMDGSPGAFSLLNLENGRFSPQKNIGERALGKGRQ